jgi:hypothetical protein
VDSKVDRLYTFYSLSILVVTIVFCVFVDVLTLGFIARVTPQTSIGLTKSRITTSHPLQTIQVLYRYVHKNNLH